MQINRLRLVNFRQHEYTELELGPGLIGIVGPNGAGKTTLLEAIAWAMYGMTAARGGRDSIRRRGAPPRSRVEVEMDFSLGAHHYRVVRGLHGAELYQDGDPAPIATSIGAVTERVTRLLGMSRDEFFNTYFTGQKELAVMAAMSAPERARFLSRVLGYERIRAAQDRLKEKRTALRARVDTLRAGLADPAELAAAAAEAAKRVEAARRAESGTANGLAAAEARVREVRPRWESLQRLRDTAMALDAERRVADHQLTVTIEAVDRLDRQRRDAAGAGERLSAVLRDLAPLDGLRAEAEALDAQAEAYAARKGYLAQLDGVRAHLLSVEQRQSRIPAPDLLDSSRARIEQLRASAATATLDVETRRTAWVRDAQDAKTKRLGLLEQYQDLREQRQRILNAGPDGDCPTCARPLGAQYAKVLELLDRQIEEVRSNGNYFKQRIDQLDAEPPELTAAERQRESLEGQVAATSSELARLHAQAQEAGPLHTERARLLERIGEIESSLDAVLGSYDEARHDTVVRRIKSLEPLALQAERLRVVTEQAGTFARDLAAAEFARAEAEARVAALADRYEQLGFSEAAYRQGREEEAAAARARQDAEVAAVRARSETAAATEAQRAVARRQEERVVREREAAAAAHELQMHQELDRALTDLRTELNAALRPELSELASGFLRDLTNGRYTDVELDEDYVATLLDDGVAKPVISGGEEDVTNLALRLAISQMIAERAGQPLSLLILDEIFGSLDEDRRVAVVDLLRSLADRFPQVILITHIDSVREGFDRVIRVGYDLASGIATAHDEPIGGHDVAA